MSSAAAVEIRAYEEERWEQFFGKHGRKAYTPNFNTALEGLIFDRGADLHERVYAAAVLMSWGNHSDYAIQADGEICGQTAVGRLLRVPKQRVTEAVKALRLRKRLQTEGRKIYPVDDPQAHLRAESPGSPDNSRTKGEGYKAFHASWIAENAERHLERQEARAIVDDINKEELRAYKAWLKSQTPATKKSAQASQTPRNGAHSSNGLSGHSVTDSTDVKSGTGVTNAPASLYKKANSLKAKLSFPFGEESEVLKRDIRSALSRSKFALEGKPLDDATVINIGNLLVPLPLVEQKRVLDQLEERLRRLQRDSHKRSQVDGWGYVVRIVSGLASEHSVTAVRRPQPQDLPQETEKRLVGEEIKRLIDLIEHFPDHTNVDVWREEITQLKSRQAAGEGEQ